MADLGCGTVRKGGCAIFVAGNVLLGYLLGFLLIQCVDYPSTTVRMGAP